MAIQYIINVLLSMLSTRLSIGNKLRSKAKDTNVKCKVVGGLTAFTFKMYILDDLDNKINSSTVLMPKEITYEHAFQGKICLVSDV